VRRGATLGGLNVSWRWELGIPMLLLGAVIAGLTVGLAGAGLLFWFGAALVAAGVVIALR
jgi:hypothetical protein